MTITTGNPFALECVVAGTPELSTRWFKDGRELSADSKHHITFVNKVASLKIPCAEMSDKGLYSFEVKNSVGKSNCTVSVHVSGEYYEVFMNIYFFLENKKESFSLSEKLPFST